MDESKKNNFTLNHHAYILQGQTQATREFALSCCYAVFCLSAGCTQCSTCILIKQQQFYAVKWFNQISYTVEDFDTIFATTKFKLQDYEKIVFVIEHADTINDYAANKLLKLIEEPATGYYFLLLTNNAHQLLPTIRSRCIIQSIYAASQAEEHPLITCFTQTVLAPTEFMTYLTKAEITEYETKQYMEEILAYWLTHYKTKKLQKSKNILYLIQQELNNLPVSGGSKIFWKNLYLRFNMVSH